MIRAGELREFGTIQQPVNLPGNYGKGGQSWQDVGQTWFRLRNPTDTERFTTLQVEGVATYEIQMRYRKGLNARMRIVHRDGRIFNLISLSDPDGRRTELLGSCTEASG